MPPSCKRTASSMHAHQRRRCEDDRRTDQPARAHQERAQAGQTAIRGMEIRGSFSRTIGDQPLVLDEHGFGHHGTGADGTGEPGGCRQQMQKQDGQVAHRQISQDHDTGEESSRILKFAMHRDEAKPSKYTAEDSQTFVRGAGDS